MGSGSETTRGTTKKEVLQAANGYRWLNSRDQGGGNEGQFVHLLRFGQIRVKAVELLAGQVKLPARVFGLELRH
jgi:hypothetical protein